MALATFAISAASAGAGFMAQREQADQQNRYAAENRNNALRAFEDRNVDINRRITQEREAAANERFESGLKARSTRATNEVAAGEAGISGLSLEGLLADIDNAQSRYVGTVDQNLDWTEQQLASEKRGAGAQTVDRINSVRRAERPSLLNLGLQIGTAAVNSATSYNRMSNPTRARTS